MVTRTLFEARIGWVCAAQVFQRQLSKEGLQQLVNNSSGAGGGGGGDRGADATSMSAAAMSSEDLRDLFRLRAHTASDTYDAICCADDDADEAADEDGGEPGGVIDLGTQTVNKEQASSSSAPWDASQKR